MALLFIDGFGGGNTNEKWDIASAGTSVQTATPRIAGGYYAAMSSVRTIYKTIPASARVFWGMGVSSDRSWNMSFFSDSGATRHITVVRNAGTGFLELRRGTESGTLLGTGTTPIGNYIWHYFEISVTISDTIGEVHVRMNGATTDEISYVGDTRNGGTATDIDRVSFYSGNGAAATAFLADCYICNDLGSTNNNFLGDVAVRTLNPVADGTYSQLVGSDADSVNNYLLVDEHPPSGTDYVGSSTPGQKDTYTLANLPAGVSAVYGVQITGSMAKNDASLGQARYVLRSGGTDYGGTTRVLTTSFITYSELYETDPATGVAWTPSGVNNMESGMEVM